jgi:hypothetical protein
MSSMAIEMPARVASRKPLCSSLSAKHHGLLQAALAEAGVDQARDFLLLQRLVDVAERQALGQDLRQQRAADGGVDQLGLGVKFAVSVLDPFGQAHRDLGGDLDHAVVQRALQFQQVEKTMPSPLPLMRSRVA